MICENNLYVHTKEFGDYQTPESFALKVCNYIKEKLEFNPDIILEPTFGLGSFIKAALTTFDNINKIFGVEISKEYYKTTSENMLKYLSDDFAININLFQDNIFNFDFNKIKSKIDKNENILILGNPPWVTNSGLETIGSTNIPCKGNFKNYKGLDAITGMSNFDVAEFIILQLLKEFQDYNFGLAMLCKSIVAKNIIKSLKEYPYNFSEIKYLSFDANKIFGVNCEAGLLFMKIGKQKKLTCDVYDINNSSKRIRSFGWIDNNFISNIDNYNIIFSIDGLCPFTWRQGVKHDCSKVMELYIDIKKNILINNLNEEVDIEEDCIYPLLKSSDLKSFVNTKLRKYVILTQKHVNQDTQGLKIHSPKLWKYLNLHEEYFKKRKSSIYYNKPKFSIFGIGDYSFKSYKVAISGFYKNPIFVLASGEKPIMFDDTCYFLGFDDYKTALITMLLLNSEYVQNFIKSIAFLDSKRPYTKDILMRIDILKVAQRINYTELKKIGLKLNISTDFEKRDFDNYVNQFEINKQISLFI